MKSHICLLIGFVLLQACQTSRKSDELVKSRGYKTRNYGHIPTFVTGAKFTRALPGDFRNLHPNKEDILVHPLELIRILETVRSMQEVLDRLKVRYFALGLSALDGDRFGSLAPWDRDFDIGVVVEDIDAHDAVFISKLSESGLEIIGEGISQRQCYLNNSHCLIGLKDAEIERRLKSQFKGTGLLDKMSSFAGVVQLHPFTIVNGMLVNRKGDKRVALQDTFPIKLTSLNGIQVALPSNLDIHAKVFVGSKFSTTFISQSDSTKKIVIDDLRHLPDFLVYIHSYLKYVFGEKVQGFAQDLEEVMPSKG